MRSVSCLLPSSGAKNGNPFENIVFQLGDVANMPYKSVFDLVTCLDVGEHLPSNVYF